MYWVNENGCTEDEWVPCSLPCQIVLCPSGQHDASGSRSDMDRLQGVGCFQNKDCNKHFMFYKIRYITTPRGMSFSILYAFQTRLQLPAAS